MAFIFTIYAPQLCNKKHIDEAGQTICFMGGFIHYAAPIQTEEGAPVAQGVNSLTIKNQTTKFSSANFQKTLSPSYIIVRIQRREDKQCKSR